ncbi:MAG: hypothetical protein ACRD0L_00730 [Acidimicrobiales bacterium]
MPTHLPPPSVVRRTEVQGAEEQGADPRTQPSAVEVKVTDWGWKPVGTAAPAGPEGGAVVVVVVAAGAVVVVVLAGPAVVVVAPVVEVGPDAVVDVVVVGAGPPGEAANDTPRPMRASTRAVVPPTRAVRQPRVTGHPGHRP